MRFAFLVHPLTEQTRQISEMSWSGNRQVGSDLINLAQQMHLSVAALRRNPDVGRASDVRVVDELSNLVSASGVEADGRLYEIPMDAFAILEDPNRALEYMDEAVQMATDWGAKIVGLGSMTGVVGSQGEYMAEKSPVPITTGNSLTVFAAIENLHHACREAHVDLADETLAIIGVPGSIATAAARILRPLCKSMILVGRRSTGRSKKLAKELDAEISLDIQGALKQASIVFSATSSGACIEQRWLRSGAIVSDVAVPIDVVGMSPERDDVLILTGGMSRVPETMAMDSKYLWLHHGLIPSCLAETSVLGLEDRTECFSLGRNLCPEKIAEIGELATAHGFTFSHLYSFGIPIDESALVSYHKARFRNSHGLGLRRNGAPHPHVPTPAPADLGDRAGTLHSRYINPVMMALGADDRFIKTFVRGEGTRVWDDEGRDYLDFVAGYGSLNVGHNHPTVTKAVQVALTESAPGFSPAAVNPYASALAEALATVAPAGLEMSFFTNSGTEAVEAALKLARKATGRTGFVYCDRSYHGKSLGSLSVTGNDEYQQPFKPLVPDCVNVPFGDLDQLERRLRDRTHAAFIVEPIQGEGGMRVAPTNYLFNAKKLCEQYGTLLIVDEVQTGLGRTGRMFASQSMNVCPDIMTLAKSLSGGMVPLGAMMTRRDLWLRAYGTIQTFALHTSTFSGGSLACAAGLATLRAIEAERLADNAAARGRQLMDGLQELCRRSQSLVEVRGEGLMIGLEFAPLPDSIAKMIGGLGSGKLSQYLVPDMNKMLERHISLYVMNALLQTHGIYTQAARSNPRVLRIQPPLTITSAEVDRFLAAVSECCDEADFANNLVDGVVSKSGLGQYDKGESTESVAVATENVAAPSS